MKSERIYAAIGDAEDGLFDCLEDTPKGKGKKSPWLKWGALAACLALAVFAGGRLLPIGAATESLVISAYENAVFASYATPESGKWFYFSDVSAALEEYAGEDALYLLAFQIFSDAETGAQLTEGELDAELLRLTGLGLDVGYMETWEYEGAGDRFYYTVAAGYFSAEQLEHFPASENYGYIFHFITDGNGKAMPAQQGLITDYSFGDGIGVS